MTKKMHVSEVVSARFEAAVTASLKELVESRQVFSVSAVIANAKYEDGAKVGATTIYAKGASGKVVHASLLARVKAAAVASRSRRAFAGSESSPSSGPSAESAVFKQLVEQECRLQEAEAACAGMRHRLANAQEQRYLALACLNALSKGAVLDIIRPLRELEAIFDDERLVVQLKEEAQALAAVCGRLARST